jgi:hypothetical protein
MPHSLRGLCLLLQGLVLLEWAMELTKVKIVSLGRKVFPHLEAFVCVESDTRHAKNVFSAYSKK